MAPRPLTERTVKPLVAYVVDRPTPPEQLSDTAQEIWNVIVNRLPGDWFPAEVHDMLAAYCTHAVTSNKLNEILKVLEERDAETLALDPEYLKQYKTIVAMRRQESLAMASLATKLRMTIQSTRSASKSKEVGNVKAVTPWDTEEYDYYDQETIEG